MPTKQVFSAYDRQSEAKAGQFWYCPLCRTELSLREKGSQPRPACPSCGFVHYRNPLPGVVVVIENEGSVLLGQRSGGFGAGKWGLPQGYIEFDESFLSAAIRETRDETGLDVEIRSILNVVSNFLSPTLHTLAIIVLAGITGGELQAGDDLEALAWVPVSGPLPDMAFEADTRIIERVRETQLKRGLPVDPDHATENSWQAY
jgi:ADP-ribose pyrophosphatase YjhB (NUDIX family)